MKMRPLVPFFVAATFLYPHVAQAHCIDPAYMALGIYSLYPIVTSLGLLLAPLLVIHTLILYTLVSYDRNIWGVLWRAILIFFCAKAAECLPGLAFLEQAWHSNVSEAVYFTVFLFAAGFAANLLMIAFLFRKDGPNAWRLLAAAFALSINSYSITMLFVRMAFYFTWM